ncbi:MAG: dTDP-glucose 4,6-dehydratase [bacterium]
MKILVTGGAGFIGSNFIRYFLQKRTGDEVINLDLLTYAGNLLNLEDVMEDPHYHFVHGDIADPAVLDRIFRKGIHVVVNFAAESHVDRSIEDPGVFIRTNVMGTQAILNAMRKYPVDRLIQISTDEVYGSLGPDGAFTEKTPLAPNSPYSASKASSDLLVRAHYETYGLPCIITRCSNNYGPYQFPEKMIPLFIMNALQDKPLPLYGDGLNVRDWLHVLDHCRAIDLVMDKGMAGEVYNIGGNNEKKNIEITGLILDRLGKPESLIRYVTDRLGHDRRYAIDAGKIRRELGWAPLYTFEKGIEETIRWYQEHQLWLEDIQSGRYSALSKRIAVREEPV